MISLKGRNPIGHHGRQTLAARLLAREPNGLEGRLQSRRIVLGRPARTRPGRARASAQSANGRLAMITENLDRLIDEQKQGNTVALLVRRGEATVYVPVEIARTG